MRADGSHRVVLNTPIHKNIKFGDANGEEPQNGIMLFMGNVDGSKIELLQLKMKINNAKMIWKEVKQQQAEM
jgi:Ran-binding protein 3